MTQGAQHVEDLDVLILSRSLKPTKIKLFGRTWTIRRDFTAEQIAEYWVLVDSGKIADAMKMLVVGDEDAQQLAVLFSAVPTEMLTQPIRRIYQMAGLLRRPDDDNEGKPEGESTAS